MQLMTPGAPRARFIATVLAALAALAMTGAATAQDDASPDDDGAAKARATAVDEIVVTAQKRAQRLEETPVSVTAFDSEELWSLGVTDVKELGQFTPNMNIITNTGGNTGVTINIRGAVTTDPIVTLDPTVGIYVDDVYVAKSVGSLFDVMALEQVEVLRGPQGTLYGRNTNGGAVKLTTRQPTGDWGLRTDLSAGSYAQVTFRQSVDFAFLGENGFYENDKLGTFSGYATFGVMVRDGFYENGGTLAPAFLGGIQELSSKEYDDIDRLMGFVKAQWVPSDWFDLEYRFDITHGREQPTNFQLSGVRPGSPFEGLLDGSLGGPDLRQPERADKTPNDASFRSDVDVVGHGLTMSGEIPTIPYLGDITVKSITSYRSLENGDNTDLDGTNLPLTAFQLDIWHGQVTQEIQFLGKTWEDRIHYVIGGYYFHEEARAENPQSFAFGAEQFKSAQELDNDAFAFFAQGTAEVLEGLELTAGLRYTYEKRRAGRNFQLLATTSPGIPFFPFQTIPLGGLDGELLRASDTFDRVSPMGVIQYTFRDDWMPDVVDEFMLYAKISEGFKSGGFNGRATQEANFLEPYKEEVLTAYEIAFRSRWLDNRVQLNGTGFWSAYDDLQVTVFRAQAGQGAESVVLNAADAKIWGAEIELVTVPLEGLQFSMGYGLLRPEYERFEDGGVDVSDLYDFPLAPEHSINLQLLYTFEPFRFGTLSLQLNGQWQSESVAAVKNNDLNALGSRGIMDMRITLADIPMGDFGHLDLAFWGRNLTDEAYREFGIDFGGFGFAGNTYGNPRTFGVDMRYRWDAIEL